MSGRESIHPLTEASIELQGPSLVGMVSQFGCGCELRDGWEATTGKWWLCGYHEGFEDGVERWRSTNRRRSEGNDDRR